MTIESKRERQREGARGGEMESGKESELRKKDAVPQIARKVKQFYYSFFAL